LNENRGNVFCNDDTLYTNKENHFVENLAINW